MKINEIIREKRKALSLTQEQIADFLGVSTADFCSTDTAGGLDNKKRRYAPRGGVAYRLFLWGFPKGATPPFGTRLCEAKCSVLYALSALP